VIGGFIEADKADNSGRQLSAFENVPKSNACGIEAFSNTPSGWFCAICGKRGIREALCVPARQK